MPRPVSALDEIKPPAEMAGGTFWKWMALQDGILYALIGEQEMKDEAVRWRREAHGWPWNEISRGHNQPVQPGVLVGICWPSIPPPKKCSGTITKRSPSMRERLA